MESIKGAIGVCGVFVKKLAERSTGFEIFARGICTEGQAPGKPIRCLRLAIPEKQEAGGRRREAGVSGQAPASGFLLRASFFYEPITPVMGEEAVA